MNRFILYAVPLIIVFGMFAMVLHFDAVTTRIERKIYCQNVASGHWPDYDGTFDTECCPPATKESSKKG